MRQFGVSRLLLLSIGMGIAAQTPLVDGQALDALGGASTGGDEKVELLQGLDRRLIDTGADPCVNFAEYACGNFTKLYPIPPDKSGFGTGAMVYDYTQVVLHSMLDNVAVDDSKRTASEQKIGDFYATCMNEDAIHTAGLKPL